MTADRPFTPASSLILRALRRIKRLILGLVRAREQSPSEPRNRHLWSIGIYQGVSPLGLGPRPASPNPVLTREDVADIRASFVADPFLVRHGDLTYMFFEAFNLDTGRGEVGLARSSDGTVWSYEKIVLREPFHLSYPQVFAWEGEHYMIPEANATQSVRLYRATRFPEEWVLEAVLMEGERFSDPTILRYADRWWLFVETSPRREHDCLRLYSASSLQGPWLEHPASPIVLNDPRSARPAGRILSFENRLLRFAQDCVPAYGAAVRTFEIVELTPTRYREVPFDFPPELTRSGAGWNADGMHHLDALRLTDGKWIAAVDGWYWATRREVLRLS